MLKLGTYPTVEDSQLAPEARVFLLLLLSLVDILNFWVFHGICVQNVAFSTVVCSYIDIFRVLQVGRDDDGGFDVMWDLLSQLTCTTVVYDTLYLW